jgi:two-component system chemotaxis response regulator CheY
MGLGRVLVVDDEADVRKSVRLTLTKAGYDVVEAEDGQKAIAAIRSDDNPLMVDTIICDLYMPKVNGMEAIAFFRSQFPSVPVIVLTGQPDVQNASALFKQGVVDYLVKPVEPAKLTAAVAKAAKEHVLFKDQFKT